MPGSGLVVLKWRNGRKRQSLIYKRPGNSKGSVQLFLIKVTIDRFRGLNRNSSLGDHISGPRVFIVETGRRHTIRDPNDNAEKGGSP